MTSQYHFFLTLKIPFVICYFKLLTRKRAWQFTFRVLSTMASGQSRSLSPASTTSVGHISSHLLPYLVGCSVHLFRFVTSTVYACAWPSCALTSFAVSSLVSPLMSHSTTSAPCFENSRAKRWPRAPPDPVISTNSPSMGIVCGLRTIRREEHRMK